MGRAELDPALGIRVLGVRELRYQAHPELGEDRPPHVRAASGLAMFGGRLAVIQDDAAFIAFVAGNDVSAVALPRGAGGRRRFEVALGNKAEKLDLEACVAVGDELWAFGSGSTPARERIAIIGYDTHIHAAEPLYRRMRDELETAINIEGAACVGSELWLFHRGNTNAQDVPAVVRFDRASVARWLAGEGPVPEPTWSEPYDLGGYGFTDAVEQGGKVFYLAAAEASPNAIDDGAVTGAQLGVIDGPKVRATMLVLGDAPAKAEGIAFAPGQARRAWITVDPDDIDQPAQLYEIELVGPW